MLQGTIQIWNHDHHVDGKTTGIVDDMAVCFVIHSHQVWYVEYRFSLMGKVLLPNSYAYGGLVYYTSFLTVRVQLPVFLNVFLLYK